MRNLLIFLILIILCFFYFSYKKRSNKKTAQQRKEEVRQQRAKKKEDSVKETFKTHFGNKKMSESEKGELELFLLLGFDPSKETLEEFKIRYYSLPEVSMYPTEVSNDIKNTNCIVTNSIPEGGITVDNPIVRESIGCGDSNMYSKIKSFNTALLYSKAQNVANGTSRAIEQMRRQEGQKLDNYERYGRGKFESTMYDKEMNEAFVQNLDVEFDAV